MWTLITTLLTRWVALKALLKALGSLGWLLPLAFVLKAIGIPALILLAILGLPLLIVLFVFGLPLILVVVVGGALLGFTFWMLSLGLVVLKLALPVIVIIWLVRAFTKKGSQTPEPPPATP
ncbi:MAG: hypothetical protein IPK85_15525 [Gemmatimonadetes bacterium]|nr:hypothetical protein [Gemmatimonadota bacterium]